ncbi:B12-binding domain-containing radical SAM protein [Bacillus fonticola]|uniref:B12-binding domain-containing radical SAM protein n=1 Tax=Bacillus fonticola TaxID=2728853 RepID=UPI0014749801|nr:radical SAM protein [Bacillus fonticola]
MNDMNVILVQLPFPSQGEPLPQLSEYYKYYNKKYRQVFPEYYINDGELWEMPLWVAHMDGAIDRDDTIFLDLSKEEFNIELCLNKIVSSVSSSSLIFFSPLAQNFSFTSNISSKLKSLGYTTVIGGNMADLASPEDYSKIYAGISRKGIYDEIVNSNDLIVGTKPKLGRQQTSLSYKPKYRLLKPYDKKVPLIRINASHGCLYSCSFCGDAWTKQLHEVDLHHLREEVEEIRINYPDTKIIYIGDKTFGQSKQAVKNLLEVLKPEYGFKLIVQTHILQINDWLLDAMEKLNVKVVEMGFETADSQVLKEMKKGHKGSVVFEDALKSLKDRGFKTVLNILSGLPNETRESQNETIKFINETKNLVWLYNHYNFVPYPKTPLYPIIKDRITNWNFDEWREDKPPVFTPKHQSVEDSYMHFLNVVDFTTDILKEQLLQKAGD